MKKIFLLAITYLISLATLSAQSLPTFDRIILTGNVSVLLVEGDQENMEIKNDRDQLEFEVEGRTLKITAKNLIKYNQQRTVKLILTYTELLEIKARAGASVYSQHTIEADHLQLKFLAGANGELTVETRTLNTTVSEGGSVDLRGATDFHEVKAVTGGSLTSYDLDAKDVLIKSNTGGSAKIIALNSLDATAKTGGVISYKGNPQKVREKDGLSGTIKSF